MRRFTVILLIAISFTSESALACSFARGYETFMGGLASPPDTSVVPTTPGMSVLSLRRGYDDGNFASCSDAGILVIGIDDAEAAKDLGFVFRVESGSFPDEVFPSYTISPIELEDGLWGFHFVWLDLPQGKSEVEPINVRLYVQAISPTNARGEKVFLDVRDP